MQTTEVDVLVVGGGPVGLATSIELARQGVSALVVERHETTSIFPKARLISTRTMELVRGWGLQEAVERAGLPREESLAVGVGSTLVADDLQRSVAEIAEDAPHSPTYTYLCSQDKFEVILRELADSTPAVDVRFATTLTELNPGAEHVDAVVESARGRQAVRARYVVAADGGRSGIRSQLGIGMSGPPPIGHMISIMFDADIGQLLVGRKCALYFLRSELPCAVEAVDYERRWMVQTGYDPEEGGSPADFTPERCVEIVRAAVGVDDLAVDVVGVMPWLQQAVVADRFTAGRVFLAGDAAHVATPQGGFGMNCGIQDGHNLAWKLAAVLRGQAGTALLDTYEAERRPIAERTVEASLHNALITFRMMEGELSMDEAITMQADRRSSEGLVLGFGYHGSAAVVADGSSPPAPADPYRTFVPTACPGYRAPHSWLTRQGAQVSTVDLFRGAFTLLTPQGSGWTQAAKQAAKETGVVVDALDISDDGTAELVSTADWTSAYGIEDSGAVLVRPDGHVAWRTSTGPASPDELVRVLDTVLARG